VHSHAREILFDRGLREEIENSLMYLCTVDLAHVLMLAEEGIIPAQKAGRLLKAVQLLMNQGFEPLKHRQASRGLYLLYESYLIENEGASVGGILQMGRSRNDLNATIARLATRRQYIQLVRSALHLQAAVIKRAQLYQAVVMPAYTHGQAAEPITYGHYLAGIGTAIERDICGLISAADDMDTCVLGAGAVAGSCLPLNTSRTAELLGFTRVSRNSVDAVASRDFVLRLLASMAVYGTTLSRIATDLLQWLTAEFNFLSLPDTLVGSSSAMPQKRNPFILEHVQGRTASALGAFVTATSATRNVPFTNNIGVGTESMRPLWQAFTDITDASMLCRLMICGATPRSSTMRGRAAEGFTHATALATKIALRTGIDFRTAHFIVGKGIHEKLTKGLLGLPEIHGISLDSFLEEVSPESCVRANRWGGGPAPESLALQLRDLRTMWFERQRSIKAQEVRWQTAAMRLHNGVTTFCHRALTDCPAS